MRYLYTPSSFERIVQYEDEMLEKYRTIINGYSAMFSPYNGSLRVSRIWINTKTKEKSYFRLPHQNGYSCYVYCDIEKDGKIFRHYTTNGEADYYELSIFWNISSIFNLFFRKSVTLYAMAENIEEELRNCLEYVKHST